jgi:hypothetical protein
MKAMGARANQRLQLDDPAPAPVALVTVPPPEPEDPAAADMETQPANSPIEVAQPAEPKRREKKQVQHATIAKHMGTIETPYVRQRDNTPTRKVSVILPVDLARELQIFCVQTGQRTNTFHEEALRAALARAKNRNASR